MSINFPTFTDKEIPSPEKFNDFVQAVEAKFTAGLGSAEIQWPLVAAGNLVMSGYQVTGGKQIMKVVNAADSTYSNDFAQALVDASGGAVFIPPGHTARADGAELAGSNCAIIGAGPTSVLKLSGDTAGYLLRNATSGGKFMVANLTLDGNSETSDGLHLRGVTYAIVQNVWFQNFGQVLLTIEPDGTTDSQHVLISDCHFNGGTKQLLITDGNDISGRGCYVYNSDDTAIEATNSGGTATLQRLSVVDNIIEDCDEQAVYVRGGSSSFSTLSDQVLVANNIIDTSGMDGTTAALEIGTTSNRLQHVTITGNLLEDAPDTAISVCAKYGTVSGNVARGAGAVGLDLTSSQDLLVTGNSLRDATTYGIDASDTTDCVVRGNDCEDATTADISYDASTDHYDNGDVVAPGPPRTFYTNSSTITIPANLLHVNDHMRIVASADVIDGGADTLLVNVDGQTATSMTVSGTDPGQVYATADVVVTGATSFDSMFLCITESGVPGANTGRYQQTGISLSSAVTVTMSNTGASITRTGLLVELSRTENQS